VSSLGDNPWTNSLMPEPEQRPKREAPNSELGIKRQVGSETRRVEGGRSAVVLVEVTSHQGARESRVQGKGPECRGVADLCAVAV
jgi:hypothetical protein